MLFFPEDHTELSGKLRTNLLSNQKMIKLLLSLPVKEGERTASIVGKAPGADAYAADTDPGGIAAGTELPHACCDYVGFFIFSTYFCERLIFYY